MFQDAREIPQGTLLQTDIAVIGGGIAGITTALSLASKQFDVCLIESGGFEPEVATQALYEGELGGLPYPLSRSRVRALGGSSQHWGGYCRPLDPIDFEARPEVPYSGWPFTYQELVPYYQEAASWLGIAAFEGSLEAAEAQVSGPAILKFPCGTFQNRMFHFSAPLHFGKAYRQRLAQQAGLSVLLHANVVRLQAAENARAVNHLIIRCLDGKQFQLRAKVFILAAGGLENPRLLLASNDVESQGIGNANDMVGRFFMEHPHLSGFCDAVALPDLFSPLYLYVNGLQEGKKRLALGPSESLQKRAHLLNAHLMFSLTGGVKQIGSQPLFDGTAEKSHWQMLKAAQGVAGWSLQSGIDRFAGQTVSFGGACEQAPHPASRVTLSLQRDALEMPRLKLDWRLDVMSRRSFIETLRYLGRELGAMNRARLRLTMSETDPRWAKVIGGNHHMGTTRIAIDPKQGVVDAQCKVHGYANLFIAGSSVFPTGGSANPTFTLVALALRLVDHIQRRYRREGR